MKNPEYTYAEIADEFHPDNINPQPSSPIVVYLFSQAVNHPHDDYEDHNPTTPLPLNEHMDELGEFTDTLDDIDELGWIERTTDTISLTPTGVQVAGPLYTQVVQAKDDNRLTT